MAHTDIPISAIFFGNVQGGVYISHWEVSQDDQEGRQRSSDKMFADFEYDRNDILVAKFRCREKVPRKS